MSITVSSLSASVPNSLECRWARYISKNDIKANEIEDLAKKTTEFAYAIEINRSSEDQKNQERSLSFFKDDSNQENFAHRIVNALAVPKDDQTLKSTKDLIIALETLKNACDLRHNKPFSTASDKIDKTLEIIARWTFLRLTSSSHIHKYQLFLKKDILLKIQNEKRSFVNFGFTSLKQVKTHFGDSLKSLSDFELSDFVKTLYGSKEECLEIIKLLPKDLVINKMNQEKSILFSALGFTTLKEIKDHFGNTLKELVRFSTTDVGGSREEVLEMIALLQKVKELNLSFIQDGDIPLLQKFKKLESLNITSQISDDGLKNLNFLKIQLHILKLNSEAITGQGLEQLKDFTELKHLHLINTKIEDKDLVHLVNMRKLEHLNLTGSQIAKPDGLSFLDQLGKLTTIELVNCPVVQKYTPMDLGNYVTSVYLVCTPSI